MQFRVEPRGIARWLDAAHIPSMIIGGVAASVLGRPRLTQDVGALAVLPEADWAEAVRLAPQYKDIQDLQGLLLAQRAPKP
jgi:hypothetical protein